MSSSFFIIKLKNIEVKPSACPSQEPRVLCLQRQPLSSTRARDSVGDVPAVRVDSHMLRQVSFCNLLLKIALVFCSVWLGCALWIRVATDPCSNCGCWSPGCHRVSPHFHPLTPCGCVSGFSEAGLSGKLCFGQHLLTPCLGIWPLMRSVLWDMPRFPLWLNACLACWCPSCSHCIESKAQRSIPPVLPRPDVLPGLFFSVRETLKMFPVLVAVSVCLCLCQVFVSFRSFYGHTWGTWKIPG